MKRKRCSWCATVIVFVGPLQRMPSISWVTARIGRHQADTTTTWRQALSGSGARRSDQQGAHCSFIRYPWADVQPQSRRRCWPSQQSVGRRTPRLKTRRSWPSAAGGGCNRSPIRSAGSRASSWNTLATNIRVPGISALRSLAGAAWQARRPGGSERPLNSFVHFAASKPTSRGLAFGYISLYRTPPRHRVSDSVPT
jgi:hypothetical protein